MQYKRSLQFYFIQAYSLELFMLSDAVHIFQSFTLVN